ncbi:hypothetical protein OUZ56_026428 [Daphnia magna]|uniref:Uncharacterized protein n=1 Tax=Daphnia magna TaxID=35525 RepID=A0ABQ9ZLV5_9CRUS|nr:hypothetical protein OUZ56_026428 [Daphnia magna]
MANRFTLPIKMDRSYQDMSIPIIVKTFGLIVFPILPKSDFETVFLRPDQPSSPWYKFPDRDSIKTRISQPPDTGTPTLLQRPVDRPTLFLRLYPRDGADGAAISGILCH